MKQILVIRGGAIGDFVLTLPAIKLLRDRFADAHLEILGVKHIAALAEQRFYADAVRSIDAPPLARFFAANADLPADLVRYFASFDLVVNYVYDADRIFETNLRKCGDAHFISGPAKLGNAGHAASQLARPLEALGLRLTDPAARIFPTNDDRAAVRHLQLQSIALHPGSGSEEKNWPLEKWIELGSALLAQRERLLIIGGEADNDRVAQLKKMWGDRAVRFAENLPLPQLAALLEGTRFVGHDSGISHIAAAVGARCLLLFGKTDPAIWAPANENVAVLRAPEGNLRSLAVDTVSAALRERL